MPKVGACRPFRNAYKDNTQDSAGCFDSLRAKCCYQNGFSCILMFLLKNVYEKYNQTMLAQYLFSTRATNQVKSKKNSIKAVNSP